MSASRGAANAGNPAPASGKARWLAVALLSVGLGPLAAVHASSGLRVGLGVPPAHAEEPTEASADGSADAAAAAVEGADSPEVLFERANEAYKAGQLDEAEALYRQALEQKDSYDIAANLARVLLDRQRYAEAAELLARVVQQLPPSVSDSVRGRLEQALAEAASSSLELRVTSSAAGAVVSVDGRELGTAPLRHRVFVEPGDHKVEAVAEGHEPASAQFSGQAGGKAEVSLTLVALPTTRTGQGGEDDELPVWPVGVGAALTVVLFAVGGVMVAVSSGQESDADARRDELSGQLSYPDQLCPSAPGCSELDSDYQSARSSSNAATGLFVAGGVAAAATLVYLFAWGASDSPEGETTAALLPSIGPDAAGVQLSARF